MLVVYLVLSAGLARNPRDKRNARGHISSSPPPVPGVCPQLSQTSGTCGFNHPAWRLPPAQKPCSSATSLFGRSLAQPGWPPSRVALGSALLVYKTAAVARQPRAAGYRQRGGSRAAALWVSGESRPRSLLADAGQSKHPADDPSGSLERRLVLSRWPSPQPPRIP